jgi:beta-lactamase class A
MLGACGGGLVSYAFFHGASHTLVERREGSATLVNPLLSCSVTDDAPAADLSGVRNRISETVAGLIRNKSAERISVYVRDMNNAEWTGVDEDGLYAPASLMKLPVAIAYLRNAEDDPSVLSRILALPSADENTSEYFKPAAGLEPGGNYSVKNLILGMIENSDNGAADALKENIDATNLGSVYTAFNVPIVLEKDSNNDTISPKIYMRFFRILYNASYLDKELSEQLLGVLSQTTFTEGIKAGIPDTVVAAHKYGERTLAKPGAGGIVSLELHDCGIVYARQAPYGICVMTEGADFEKLAAAIATVSKEVYETTEDGTFPLQ